MRLRTRDPSKPRRALSPAQEAANRRSFLIFRLRGLWSLAHIISAERREAVQALIDAELESLGAQSERHRDAERLAVWARIEAQEAAEAAMEEELPF